MAAHVLGHGMQNDIAAPFSGRVSTGVGTVLSTITGTPCVWAISAIACRSGVFPARLPIDSQIDGGRFVIYEFFQIYRVIVLGESRINTEFWQHVLKQRKSPAIEQGHGHYIVAGFGEIENRVVNRRLPGAERQGGHATFQLSDTLFQHIVGGILLRGV